MAEDTPPVIAIPSDNKCGFHGLSAAGRFAQAKPFIAGQGNVPLPGGTSSCSIDDDEAVSALPACPAPRDSGAMPLAMPGSRSAAAHEHRPPPQLLSHT